MVRINLFRLTLLLLSMLTIMAAAIIAPAIPAIAQFFQRTPGAGLLSKLVVSLPTLFIAITAPWVGRYIDRHGRLKLLYVGLVLYALCGTSGLFLNSLYYILIGRMLLGVAIGITMTITFTLIGDYFKGDERKDFIGFQTAFIGLAGITFLMIGGVLADISWRLPFLIYITSVLLTPLIIRFLNEPPKTPSAFKSTPAASSLLMRIIYINAVVLMILVYVVPTQLPFLLYEIGFDKNILSGAALALNALGMVISSLFYSRLQRYTHFPYVNTIAFFLMAAGYFITGMTYSYFIILAAMFTAGLGIGLLIANTNVWVMEQSHQRSRGRNIGILTTCLFLGQFFSPLVFEPVAMRFGVSFIFTLAATCMVLISTIFLCLGQSLIKMGASTGS